MVTGVRPVDDQRHSGKKPALAETFDELKLSLTWKQVENNMRQLKTETGCIESSGRSACPAAQGSRVSFHFEAFRGFQHTQKEFHDSVSHFLLDFGDFDIASDACSRADGKGHIKAQSGPADSTSPPFAHDDPASCPSSCASCLVCNGFNISAAGSARIRAARSFTEV